MYAGRVHVRAMATLARSPSCARHYPCPLSAADLTLWGQLTQGLYFAFAFIVSLKIRSDMAEGWGWLARSHSQSGASRPHDCAHNAVSHTSHRAG